MKAIRSLAVFCGSRVGINPAYAQAGRELGHAMGQAGIRLVFGGGRIGIMGVVADAVLEAGGTVLGVIPEFLAKWEVAHEGVTERVVTDTMHTRKRRLYEESDAFLIMPRRPGNVRRSVRDHHLAPASFAQQADHPVQRCGVYRAAGCDDRPRDRARVCRPGVSRPVRGDRWRSGGHGAAESLTRRNDRAC